MAQGPRAMLVAQAQLVWRLDDIDAEVFIECGAFDSADAVAVMPHNDAVRQAIAAAWERK